MKKSELKYEFLWGNTQSLLTLQMNLWAFGEFSGVILNKIKNVFQIARDNKNHCYHSIKDLNFDIQEGRRVFRSKKNTQRFFLNAKKAQKNHEKLYKKLAKINYSKLSNEELFNLYLEMVSDWMFLISHFRATQAKPTNFLMENILKKYSQEEASILTLPAEIDPIDEELIDWQKLLKQRYSKAKIKQHLLKYPWVVAAHFSFEDVEKTIRERFKYDKENISYKNIIKEKKELKEKQKLLLKNNPEIRQTINLMQRLAMNRVKIKSCWAGMDYYLLLLLLEVAKRAGVNPKKVSQYYLFEDVKKALSENRILSNTEIIKRKKCFAGLWKNGIVKFYSGNEAEKIAKRELGDLYNLEKRKTIKGSIANAGKIIAQARLLTSNNVEQAQQLRKNFKKGEVLVTEMTQPNIMDIASRAGGIITDEGGMLSHAAIISRELKIPCIVGTSMATSLIKDGDKVEIDAEKGVVNIIK